MAGPPASSLVNYVPVVSALMPEKRRKQRDGEWRRGNQRRGAAFSTAQFAPPPAQPPVPRPQRLLQQRVMFLELWVWDSYEQDPCQAQGPL